VLLTNFNVSFVCLILQCLAGPVSYSTLGNNHDISAFKGIASWNVYLASIKKHKNSSTLFGNGQV